MYDVYSCGFDGVMIRPKRVQKQKILIFAKDFACPRGAWRRQPNEQRSGPDRWEGVGGGETLPLGAWFGGFRRFGGFGGGSKHLHA